MIVAFRAPENLPAGKELPTRLLMAKWGRNDSVRGPVIINATTARILPRAQKAMGFDEIALDFSHNTVKGTEAFDAEKEPRKVAAFGTPRVVPNEGLYIENLRWTPEGKDSVANGHFPDVSPAVKFAGDKENGEVVFVHSCAVCRQGAVNDLHVFGAESEPEKLKATLAEIEQADPTTFSMNYKDLLCLFLGLDSKTATDADISTGAKAFASAVSEIKTFAAGIGDVKAFSASLGDIKAFVAGAGDLKAVAAALKSANEGVAAVNKRLDDGERANITALAIRDGKIIPLSANELPLDSFKKLIGELEAGRVPLAQRTVEGVKTFTANPVIQANTADEEVRKNMGISKEKWDAAGKN